MMMTTVMATKKEHRKKLNRDERIPKKTKKRHTFEERQLKVTWIIVTMQLYTFNLFKQKERGSEQ